MQLDDESRALLGLPALRPLAKDFLAEMARHEGTLSARQMFKARPDINLGTWMQVGLWLMNNGIVTHGWRALAQPASAAQESVYTRVPK